MTTTGLTCGNPECGVSTGIHEGLTFGSGHLTSSGFWEHPCATCARAYETAHPDEDADARGTKDCGTKGSCWPFEGQDVEALAKGIKEELDEEERAWQGFEGAVRR